MKRRFVMMANSLVAIGLLALAGFTSPAAAFAAAAPAAEISASWFFAYGARYDEQALKELPPGSFYTGPTNQPHVARTGDAAVVAYVARSEGGRSQTGWLLPAPQTCSSAPFRWGIEGD